MTTHNTRNYLTMSSQNRLTTVTTISSNYVNISNFGTKPQEVNRPHFTPVKNPLHTTCSYWNKKIPCQRSGCGWKIICLQKNAGKREKSLKRLRMPPRRRATPPRLDHVKIERHSFSIVQFPSSHHPINFIHIDCTPCLPSMPSLVTPWRSFQGKTAPLVLLKILRWLI